MTDIYETIEYRGYNIQIIQDSYACNPMGDDSNWPMITIYNRQVTSYGNIPNPIECFTDNQLVRHQKRICDIIGDIGNIFGRLGTSYDAMREYIADYKGPGISNGELIRDCLAEWLGACDSSADMQVWSELYDLAGIPNLNTCSTGYSQGDYMDILVIGTWEAAESFGWTRKQWRNTSQADMQGQVDAYGAWVWGDCYGYNVTDSDGNDIDDGSCWGFIGSDHKASGLLEYAESAIDYQVRHDLRLAAMSQSVTILKGLGL